MVYLVDNVILKTRRKKKQVAINKLHIIRDVFLLILVKITLEKSVAKKSTIVIKIRFVYISLDKFSKNTK